MHIMEGFLPAGHAIGWCVASAPFVAVGAVKIGRIVRERPQVRLDFAACGAFAFALSALKLPSVMGSCSHPTGTGLGAVVFGPSVMAVIGAIILLFQALLLAHGGLTTLGANIFSMAIVGPWVSFLVWRNLRRLGASFAVTIFFAVALGDLATYGTTAVQLALAFPDVQSGFAGAVLKFGGIYAVTQVPIAVAEGFLSVAVMNVLFQKTWYANEVAALARDARR